MADEPAMSPLLKVRPSSAFFMAGDVLVRAWTGTVTGPGPEHPDELGVTALIAGIQVESAQDLLMLTPIPPPEPGWPEATRKAMGVLWKLAGQLLEEEATALARLAMALLRSGDQFERAQLANSMLEDLATMDEDGADEPN